MDMASFDDRNSKGRPANGRATGPIESITAEFPDSEGVIDSEAELIDRLIGVLVAELFNGGEQ